MEKKIKPPFSLWAGILTMEKLSQKLEKVSQGLQQIKRGYVPFHSSMHLYLGYKQ